MKKKYIDLFAGCGGLSLGLFNAGWEGIFAVEKSEDAFQTLKHNLIDKKKHFDWPNWLKVGSHNIDTILENREPGLKELKGKVDLVAGGPPCQGFSNAGRREEDDERNKLANAYLEFVAIVKPKVLLFENVRGFGVGFKKETNERGMPHSEMVLEKLKRDWYEFKGVYTTGTRRRRHMVPCYSQAANAIPPLFAESCGIVLKELVSV